MATDILAPNNPTVYVETTIVSYLAGRPSRDALLSVHQTLTHEWWALREGYQLCTSQLVLDESNAGDAERADQRQGFLSGCQFLEITPQDLMTAKALLDAAALPAKARADAVHITLKIIERVIEKEGFQVPYLITPELLLEMRHVAN